MAITYNPGDPIVLPQPDGTAPVLLFELTQECDGKTVKLVEKTSTNTLRPAKGWGAPQLALVDVSGGDGAADMRITLPGSSTYYDTDMLTVTPPLPQSDIAHTPIPLQGDVIGLSAGDVWPDGIYTFTFYYRTDTGSATAGASAGDYITPTSVYVLLHSQVRCCLYNMLAKLDIDCCVCGDETVDNALLAYTAYKAMLYAAACGQITKANELLALVNKLCNYNSKGCSNC